MKKKIRFLINTLAGGGAEKVLVDLLNLLEAECYRICLRTNFGSNALQIRTVCLLRGTFEEKWGFAQLPGGRSVLAVV